jgi:hypothetical protein
MTDPLLVVLRLVFAGVILLGSVVDSAAQAPAIQWQHALGGSMGDEATSVRELAGGGYVISGYSGSDDGDVSGQHGTQSDFWMVKTDVNGIMNWQKTFGGSSAELGGYFVPTFDGGYIMTGYSFSNDGDVSGNHGNCDYWVVKTDDTGAIQWQRSMGGSDIDIAVSVIQTWDSGYVIAGRSLSKDGDVIGAHDSAECWIVKLSATGATLWQKCLGGSAGDGAYDVQQTFDSGLIFACISKSVNGDVTGNHGDYDVWIVKLSSTGALLWEKSLGGTGTDYANRILQTADSGYIVVGSSNSADGDLTLNYGGFDYWVVKLSASGTIQWQKSFGGSADEYAYSIRNTMDGGYIVAGTTFSGDGDVTGTAGFSDMWVVKLSSTGSLEWEQSPGGSGYDGANCVIQGADSGYVVVGRSGSDDVCASEYHGANDYLIVKLKDSTAIAGIGMVGKGHGGEIVSVLPNPARDKIKVECGFDINHVIITDLLGQVVYKRDVDARQVQVSVAGVPAGMYIVTVNNTAMTRFVKW